MTVRHESLYTLSPRSFVIIRDVIYSTIEYDPLTVFFLPLIILNFFKQIDDRKIYNYKYIYYLIFNYDIIYSI